MPKAEAKYSITAEDKTEKAFRSVQTRFRTAASVASKAAAGIGAAALGGFGVMAKAAIDGADEVSKLSREIGVSTENLSQMRGVLELTGGTFEGYTSALRKMQRNVVELADGSASMTQAFDDLGLTLSDLQGLTPEQQFDRITRALEGMDDATLRSARAQEIFGRNAQTVLRLVDAGADEVARLRVEQEAMGNTLSGNAAAGAEAFNDAWTRLQQSLRGAVLSTVGDNVEALAVGMERLAVAARLAFTGFAKAVRLASLVPEGFGAAAAAVGAAAGGNFSGAGAVLSEFGRGGLDTLTDVLGIQTRQAEEQTSVLRVIAENGIVGRAG